MADELLMVNKPRMMPARYWRGLMLVALVLGTGWINYSRLPAGAVQGEQARSAATVGFLALDFILTTTDGVTLRLSDLRGKPVVLNFWATWCPPCPTEMPALEALWQQYQPYGVTVLGVDQGESTATVERFARGMVGTTFPLLLDTDLHIGSLYAVRALPTTVFIDREGRIQEIRLGGPLNLPMLVESVEKIVAQKAAPEC